MFDSIKKSGKQGVIRAIYDLLNEADVVVHYNGKRFDIPTLNKEFLLAKLSPPAPFKQIDLYQTIKKKFRFVSNKLAYVTQQLGFPGKITTTHQLWLDCMNGNEKAWEKMEAYNRRDVTELEKVYKRVLPWIETHPNVGMFTDTDRPACTNCGCTKLQSRGIQYNRVQSYKRFQCTKCHSWVRSRFSESIPNKKNILTQCVG